MVPYSVWLLLSLAVSFGAICGLYSIVDAYPNTQSWYVFVGGLFCWLAILGGIISTITCIGIEVSEGG